jgi:hypothetical protein
MSVFVPTANGFKKLTSIPGNASASAIYEHLGYHSDQVFSQYDERKESDFHTIGFEIFSKNIIFINAKEGIESIDGSKLMPFLQKLTDEKLYDSLDVESTLSEGIDNKSLSSAFLGRILDIKDIDPDGVFFVDKLGMYLYFSNGYLVDFQSSDGLNKWAKYWNQSTPGFTDDYETEAKKHWGRDQKRVLHEVNVQANAAADVPKGMRNEYIPLHTNKNGLINFRMLLACHYDQPISLADFLALNHGRYQELSNQGKYRLGRFDYLFSNDGVLIQAVQN